MARTMWYAAIVTIVPRAMPASWKSLVNTSVVSPMAMMMPAATGTRLIGLPKSTLFSFQILAPSRPIIPYRTTVMPPSTPPGVADTSAPNFGDNPNRIATTAAT